MQEKQPQKRMTPGSCMGFGLFFLYLSVTNGVFDGNTVVLFLLGIAMLVLGILFSKPVRKRILNHYGMMEIDLEDAPAQDKTEK